MALTPEIEAGGLKAYEQARAFERLRSWRLPVWYALFPLVQALMSIALWVTGRTMMAGVGFLVAVLLTWLMWWQWKMLCARHAGNLRLLVELEKTYGDELPWVKIENHFAELEKLKKDCGRQ